MIAPVIFPPLPARPDRARSTTSPGCCPRTARPTTSTSGTATPPTAARCSTTSRDHGVNDTRVPHRRHPLGLGLRPAVRRRRPTRRPATRPASSSCAPSVTSQQPQGHHRHAAAHDRASRSRTAIKANNRHVKYLNFDDHGFSVLDVTRERAQMDWFVIGDRADQAAGLDAGRPSWATDAPAASTVARRRRAGGLMTATTMPRDAPPRAAPSSRSPAPPARRSCSRPPPVRRRPRRRAAASGSTCWSSTAAGPTRSTADLTPNLAALRDGGT